MSLFKMKEKIVFFFMFHPF